jgi:hypothetical protein
MDVAIIMGSSSDYEVMEPAIKVFQNYLYTKAKIHFSKQEFNKHNLKHFIYLIQLIFLKIFHFKLKFSISYFLEKIR